MSIRPFNNMTPTIVESAYVDEDAVVIGDVHIGEQSSIWPGAVIRGDVNYIRIGHSSNIQDGSILHVTAPNEDNPEGLPLIIGNNVTVGHGVILHACTVEDACLVGMGATVLDGAILREKTLLAAGSLVPPGKELEGGYLWMGSPAKKVRVLTKMELQFFQKSCKKYMALSGQYKLKGSLNKSG